ncbi:putative ErfK/YbiS/YcfS/YnhG protein [Legionella quinlivanii]|uniref:Putative ErfK/YbiS/YcfS/YnhG protein n=1 Tax=Legionella quinlivanii TaxID=45073 RepID=A0A0W0Y4Y4_9GAMM|nr:L,D-transpeptidase [Legionella quinlivanii]KTD51684.1 putative ErfK/YbiS/YcfS/YnhG protein [Legionella quinlivanii]MCW8451021.1 L,D-transpeptidase [Legionella quinlivanii]SEF62976.1 L,D-transpeptidase catalytic domain [Legionella quinlivanii DSM 21216]STY10789.1 putative ErfK/YbiS/YcfS/YnhG protein [Legionella quinlivanii]
MSRQIIVINTQVQSMYCYTDDSLINVYPISSAKNGLGEEKGSFRTPRGWHRIYSKLGLTAEANSVFVAREWTGEIYTEELASQFPGRDWILTRILQLDGMEPGRNQGGEVDSLKRFIYLHGTPDTTPLGHPGSHGCIRMRNSHIIALTDWVEVGTPVYIQ